MRNRGGARCIQDFLFFEYICPLNVLSSSIQISRFHRKLSPWCSRDLFRLSTFARDFYVRVGTPQAGDGWIPVGEVRDGSRTK